MEILAKQVVLSRKHLLAHLMHVLQAECWCLHLAAFNGKTLGDFLLVYQSVKGFPNEQQFGMEIHWPTENFKFLLFRSLCHIASTESQPLRNQPSDYGVLYQNSSPFHQFSSNQVLPSQCNNWGSDTQTTSADDSSLLHPPPSH